jgi:hypothetical protein
MANKSKSTTFPFEGKASINGTTMLFTQFGLDSHFTWHDPRKVGMIGAHQPSKDGRILLKNDVNGPVTILPSYAQATALLALMFDGSGTYTPKDAPSAMSVPFVCDHKDVVRTFAANWLDKLTISARENQPIEWKFDVLGTTDTAGGTVAYAAAPDPMIMSDISFVAGGNTYFLTGFDWEWSYDLFSRFHNSVTRSAATRQIYTCKLTLHFDQNSDHYADFMALAGTNTTLATCVLTATNGVNSLAVTHPVMTNVKNVLTEGTKGGEGAAEKTADLEAWSSNGTADMMSIVYS